MCWMFTIIYSSVGVSVARQEVWHEPIGTAYRAQIIRGTEYLGLAFGQIAVSPQFVTAKSANMVECQCGGDRNVEALREPVDGDQAALVGSV